MPLFVRGDYFIRTEILKNTVMVKILRKIKTMTLHLRALSREGPLPGEAG